MFKKESVELTNYKRKEITIILSNISGWSKRENTRSQSRFGDEYGVQTAFYRLLENED